MPRPAAPLLLLAAASLAAAAGDADGAAARPWALFCAIPAAGHLGPLHSLAVEVHERGALDVKGVWATDELVERLRLDSPFPVAHPAMPEGGSNAELLRTVRESLQRGDTEFERLALLSDYMAGFTRGYHAAALAAIREDPRGPPAVVVADYGSVGCATAAVVAGVDVVLNAPVEAILPHAPSYVPHMIGTMRPASTGVLDRVANHAASTAFTLAGSFTMPSLRRAYLELTGRPMQYGVRMDYPRAGVIFNSYWGVSDVAQPAGPTAISVGSLESAAVRRAAGAAPQPVEGELGAWLDAVPAGRGAMLVNFGTTGVVTPAVAGRLLRVLRRWGEEEAAGRAAPRPFVVWRVPPTMLDAVPRDLPPYVRVEQWMRPSQAAVLGHPRVRLFYSHAGLNSPMEAVRAGVPCVLHPQFFDQKPRAARLEYNGLAVSVGGDPDEDRLLAALLEVAGPRHAEMSAAARKAARRLKHAGGVRRAAEFVEEVADVGLDHLLTPDRYLPTWQYYCLDIYAVYAAVAWLLLRLARGCCRCCCRRGVRGEAKLKGA